MSERKWHGKVLQEIIEGAGGEAAGHFREWVDGVPFLRPEDRDLILDPMIQSRQAIDLLLAAALNRLAQALEDRDP